MTVAELTRKIMAEVRRRVPEMNMNHHERIYRIVYEELKREQGNVG